MVGIAWEKTQEGVGGTMTLKSFGDRTGNSA